VSASGKWYLVTGSVSAALGISGFFFLAIVNIEENGHAQPETDAQPEVAPVDAALDTSP
jgi:hypothetical protein